MADRGIMSLFMRLGARCVAAVTAAYTSGALAIVECDEHKSLTHEVVPPKHGLTVGTPRTSNLDVKSIKTGSGEWANGVVTDDCILKELTEMLRRRVKYSDGPDGPKSLIWHTLQGKGGIEGIRVWEATPDASQKDTSNLKSDEIAGNTRLVSLVKLGAKICGHPEFVHGGFAAALIDEILGTAAAQESHHLAATLPAGAYEGDFDKAKNFTANLTVNYRRPVPLNGTYLVECKVTRVERLTKIWLDCKIYDREGKVLVDASALYIITGIKKAP